MNSKKTAPIFLQICELICDDILTGKYITGQRLQSVQSMALALKISPGTVTHSYNVLRSWEIAYIKRGCGLFVAADALDAIRSFRKQQFVKQKLPDLFKEMLLLDITFDKVIEQYQDFCIKNRYHELI